MVLNSGRWDLDAVAEGNYQPFAQIGILRKIPTDLCERLVFTFRYKTIGSGFKSGEALVQLSGVIAIKKYHSSEWPCVAGINCGPGHQWFCGWANSWYLPSATDAGRNAGHGRFRPCNM